MTINTWPWGWKTSNDQFNSLNLNIMAVILVTKILINFVKIFRFCFCWYLLNYHWFRYLFLTLSDKLSSEGIILTNFVDTIRLRWVNPRGVNTELYNSAVFFIDLLNATIPTPLPPVAPEVVITANSGTASDDKPAPRQPSDHGDLMFAHHNRLFFVYSYLNK